jgi:hypothetical protein
MVERFLALLVYRYLKPTFRSDIITGTLGPSLKLFQSSKIERAIAKFLYNYAHAFVI